MDDAQLKDKIFAVLAEQQQVGEATGGSGHKSHRSLHIDKIGERILDEEGNIEVEVTFTVFTETEFTSEPDNPPYENRYHQTFTFRQDGSLKKTGEPRLVFSNFTPEDFELPEDLGGTKESSDDEKKAVDTEQK